MKHENDSIFSWQMFLLGLVETWDFWVLGLKKIYLIYFQFIFLCVYKPQLFSTHDPTHTKGKKRPQCTTLQFNRRILQAVNLHLRVTAHGCGSKPVRQVFLSLFLPFFFLSFCMGRVSMGWGLKGRVHMIMHEQSLDHLFRRNYEIRRYCFILSTFAGYIKSLLLFFFIPKKVY